jgi:hypothetical protein
LFTIELEEKLIFWLLLRSIKSKTYQGKSRVVEKHRLDSKQEIDNLIGLVKKNDWKAKDFLFKNCWEYCRIIYYRRDWHINEEDLETIINYSIGKAIAKYEICGKYWGLLSNDFPSFVSFLPSGTAQSRSCLNPAALS